MIRAIILDCFGVIVGKGFNYTFAYAGGDPQKDRPFIEDMLKQSNLGLISEKEFNEAMAHHLGKTDTEWQEALRAAEPADRELLDYIIELRKKYKTAILSNSNKGVLAQKIGEERLNACFDKVVSSAEVGLIKPNPDIYALTAERLGVDESECVFVDDHIAFVQAAERMGMRGVLYTDLVNLKKDLNLVFSH